MEKNFEKNNKMSAALFFKNKGKDEEIKHGPLELDEIGLDFSKFGTRVTNNDDMTPNRVKRTYRVNAGGGATSRRNFLDDSKVHPEGHTTRRTAVNMDDSKVYPEGYTSRSNITQRDNNITARSAKIFPLNKDDEERKDPKESTFGKGLKIRNNKH